MASLINITIDNIEVFYAPGSIRGNKTANARGTVSFRVRETKAIPIPEIGKVVGVFDRGLRIFGGTVHEINLAPIVGKPGSEAWWDVTATSWEHRLERNILDAVAYDTSDPTQPQNAGDIASAIIDLYQEVIPVSIQPGAGASELGVVIFRGMSQAAALDELAKRSNYVWYIDPDLGFHFEPRMMNYALSEVRASNLNYREPEVRINRGDYFNKASIAISYDAFSPWFLSFQGDNTYPHFHVYDPSDAFQSPVPVDMIRYIRLNGVDQDFGLKKLDALGNITEFHTIYYQAGSSTIEWDTSQPTPTPADTLTIEFYKLGANIVTEEDTSEIQAIQIVEGPGSSGIYHAHMEDMECTDEVIARKRLQQFLDLHIPSRSGKAVGYMPREYRWVSDSHKFANDVQTWVDDLSPGKVITFWPSTPVSTTQQVIIQSVDYQDLGCVPEVLRYTVSAVDTVAVENELSFFKALAELTPSQRPKLTEEVLYRATVVFGIDSASVTSDIGWYPEIAIAAGLVWRPNSATITAGIAPTGADLTIDCSYSTDVGSTWNNLFENATGDLVLGAGLKQCTTPLGKFYGFPVDLDIPSRAIVRCAVIQVGSTVAGSKVIVEITGEVRKAAPVAP